MDPSAPNAEQVYAGVAAAPGVAYGQVFVIVQRELELPAYRVEPARATEEAARLDQAVLATRAQIQQLQNEVAENLGAQEARIFDAHLLVLEDQALIGETLRELETSYLNIERCFHKVAQRYIEAFDRIDDEYLRERATDIRDVTRRVLTNLLGKSQENLFQQVRNRIVIAYDITPSDSASFERGRVMAVVTETGSKTGHAVIVARSMKVPAVVGTKNLTSKLKTGDWVLVDGYDGLVILNPAERTLFRYGKVQRQRRTLEVRIQGEAGKPSETLDGERVTHQVNIEGTDDLPKLAEFAHDGVGLFRTEYLFLNSPRIPGEEEQYEAYREVAQALAPQPVVIRTLDIGGDKPLAVTLEARKKEANPFLGLRAIRFCLENVELFKKQLRAILKASAHGKVRLMYPMISGLDELTRANALLEECRQELRAAGVAFDPDMPVGSMVEIPSAAMTADLLAAECDFFSIGTNDLIQYLLAIDRVNDAVGHLYEPTHPAVLRTIKQVLDAGHRAGIPVGICGEMGGDPVLVPLLVGLGARELSMAPGAFATVKYVLRRMRLADASALGRKVLAMQSPQEIRKAAEAFHQERVGDLPPRDQ